LDILVWYKFFLGAFSAMGFTLFMLTKGAPAAFSARGFLLSMLTNFTPAAFSALGFQLSMLTKGTPAAFPAHGFSLSMLTKGTPTTFSTPGLLLSMLTYALAWTFFAEVAIPCFPMRTLLALCLLFGGRWHVCRFTSRSLHDCSQGEWGLDLDPVDWTGTGALVLVLWSTRAGATGFTVSEMNK
jgi:hypothetical protein